MQPDEFERAMGEMGYRSQTEDYDDGTSIVWWYKYCHHLDCTGLQDHRHDRTLLYQPAVLALVFDIIQRGDCRHGQ